MSFKQVGYAPSTFSDVDGKQGDKEGAHCVPYKPLLVAIRALIAGGLSINGAQAELPIPSAQVTLSHHPVNIASQGQASAAIDGNALTIDQGTDKASIDWQSFNIGSGNSVEFVQPSASSVALNNIHQADASRIMGSLTANGQVYLVNQNGFVFGPNAQVNVNALVATTLGISDAVLQKGLTSAFAETGDAALQGNGELFLKDSQGNYVHDQNGDQIKIQIFIEDGASIQTHGAGGRVIIAAPVVTNAGSIATPDGQTILAAATDKVYLQEAGQDSDIRGLLVEVGTGGQVNNMGKVLAERGNVSLLGFAVNQDGMAKATSSVSLNGSVRLLAREGIQDPTSTSGNLLPKATLRAAAQDDGLGTKAVVHLGAGSVTSVDLDSDKSATAIDAQKTAPSRIEIFGHDLDLSGQSLVQAKSGQIDLSAVDNPADTSEKGDARVFLAADTVVDVSGVKDVSLPVDRNVVQVELRKNELRDAPLQRDGILLGQTVSVDLRDAKLSYDADHNLTSASIPIADIKGAVDRIARNIDERSTTGGTVTINSSGDVISQAGSLIDFSGGSIAYQSGYIETTQLVADGQLYDIASADPNRHYDGIYGQVSASHPQWGVTETWAIPGLAVKHYEAGYIQGMAGGALNINAYAASLQGSLDGSTVNSAYQRTADQQAAGSVFALNLSNNNSFGLQDVVFSQHPTATLINIDDALPGTANGGQVAPLVLAADLFKRSGVSQVSIKTNGAISLEQGASLALPAFGSLDLASAGADLQGAILAPSGSVSVTPIKIGDTVSPSAVTLGETARIDVSGAWVNDFLDGRQGLPLDTPLAIDGGKVTLIAEQGDLRLTEGSRIDVSGGAWADNKGLPHAGAGGAISLAAASHEGGGQPSSLILGGELTGFALTQGGSLSLSSSEVVIGSAADLPTHTDASITPLLLSPGFFRQGGFADYAITANLYGLTVADHVQLKPRQQNLVPDASLLSQASGGALEDFSRVEVLPTELRNAANLSLAFSEALSQNRDQALSLGRGAVIKTDAGGQVALSSDTSILVDGRINAPGGAIALTINTPASGDKGYFASQGIWLGEHSRLTARGVFKPQFNAYGLKTGDVLDGGAVSLIAKRGYIVTRQGSRIDVSGTSQTLDFQTDTGVIQQTVASAGGAITLEAGEGMLLDGGFSAHSGGAGVAGGGLSVGISRNLRVKPLLPVSGGLFPDDTDRGLPQTIVIAEHDNPIIPSDLAQGGAIDAKQFSGRALLNAPKINSAGFASLQFSTDVLGASGKYAGSVQFNGDVKLSADRQIVLDTPSLLSDGGQVRLVTGYAALGSTQSRIDQDQGDGSFKTALAPDAQTGAGKLKVAAQGIDLIGGLSFNGFNSVKLTSQGDVRAIGIRTTPDTKNFLGEFKLAGDLTVKAAQVYPATLTDYTFSVGGQQDETVTILANGESAPVYSAGGSLTIKAPNIVQQGVLKAPFGSLSLNASQSITLADGSVTSVSGGGLTVPFGQGSGGLNWLYPLDATGGTNIVVASPPEKRLSLNGKNIALASGAKVDLSGGGDLYAYEFITGPGGSNDILDANTPGFVAKYAVIPSLGTQALTPYDPQEFAASGLHIGDSVYLSAGSELPAGWYTLLPAHYALLPGAYLVTPQAGTRDMRPEQNSFDLTGAAIVAGRYGIVSAGSADARWQGFAVQPGGIARDYSQYTDYLANAFFSAKTADAIAPALPRDAGSLAITAQTGLTLGATLSAAPAPGGLGGQVDISADRLAIVGRREQLAGGETGTVTLLADDLNRLDAPSLLLGGSRGKSKTGQKLTVATQSLTVAGDASLEGSEILLAAQDALTVQAGATVASTGKTETPGVNLQIVNQGQNNSDGALLRVSSAAQAEVVRSGKVAGKTGELTVEAGAVLKSEHSMLLDSTQNTVFNGQLDMQGGSLALNASNISLGAAPAGTSGLVLSEASFNLDELKLTSASDFNLYGAVSVNAGLVTIDAAQINGFDNNGKAAAISADRVIQLSNSGAKAGMAGTGAGALTLSADQIQLGSGAYAINGFATVNLNAKTAIKGLGQTLAADTGQAELSAPGKLKIAGDVNLSAGHFIGDAGATTSLDASGHQVTFASPGSADPAWTAGLGASWAIVGDAISGGGRFDLPSGLLALTALRGDLNLNNGFSADVSGRTLSFAGHRQYSPAGGVTLSAEQGDVNLADGAGINLAGAVDGGRQRGDAGALTVQAGNGRFLWDGDITALGNTQADAQFKQGRFALTAEQFGAGGFSVLNRKLAAAGFTEAVALELKQGDVTLAAADTVNARQFQLAADRGQVVINGTIDAGGDRAGSVAVYGHDGIRLGATGQILAKTDTANADGGSVLLDTVHKDDTGSGLLDLAQGGLLDVSGGAGGMGGAVHLRTGRDDAEHSVAVTDIHTRIIGTDPQRTSLEATRVYDGQTAITSADIKVWQKDTSDFMAAVSKPKGFSGNLLPGLEIRGSGDLSLNNQWDLLSWRYGRNALPGFLTLRAGGDLNINATLTDAFATGYLPGQTSIKFQDVLQPGQSWSYSLIAGGNINLANSYSAPDPFGTGGKTNAQVMVRTGTGDISLNAGGDIEFTATANNPSAAAAIYTMGTTAPYTRGQLLAGLVPGVPARLTGETDAAYLNRLDPAQLNKLLRYGYFSEVLLGLVFPVAEYPTDGGDIHLSAGGDIVGVNTGQQISDWLVRSGVITENLRPTAWGININGDRLNPINGISSKGSRFFNQNIGALGGGDVSVTAGGDVRDLSVMIPTTGKPFGQVSEAPNQWTQTGAVVNGGGDLAITAGNNIVGGEFYVARGKADLNAGGSVRASANLGAILELGDGAVNVNARQDVVIASVFNPSVLKQTTVLPLGAGGDSRFFSYGDASAVNLTATAGNIVLQNDTDAIRASKNLDTSLSSGFEYAVYPGSLKAVAYSSDIRIDNSFTLFPSPQGQLTLLAGRNIGSDSDAAQLFNVNMSDADPALLPSVAAPAQQLEGSLSDGLIRARERLDPSTPDPTITHAAVPLHLGDASKPVIVAQLGDIAFASNSEVTFYLPQAAEFSAGRDISNLSLFGQNLSVNDVTRIQAGRDIRYDAIVDDNGVIQANDKQIELGGPGQLQIQAGRDINLGGSAGFNTIGNTKNTALAAEGAAINLLAGVAGKPDYAGFIKKYFALGSPYLKRLKLLDDSGRNVLAGFTPKQKKAYLLQLPDALKQPVLLSALFSEIKASASAAAAASETERKALYQRGFSAIETLFPGSDYHGDLSLVFSQIKTLAGGGINIAVPGGAVNVGLAGKVAGIAKGADELGIVVQQDGDLNALVQGDFNVNQSRVFTLGGGDIAVWSSEGNIDAGKGAKSAISAPPPITSVDAKGNIVTIFSPIVSGSGIQTINPQNGGKQGNVFLAAPVGVIDAGEAGISGGNVVIAATAVVGASNISASGASVGVPTAVAPPVVPAGAASAAASAAKQASAGDQDEQRKATEADQKKTKLTVLSVDVIGFGDCGSANAHQGKSGCGG